MYSVADPEENPAMAPIQFGYRVLLLSKEEINVRYCETYYIGSATACI